MARNGDVELVIRARDAATGAIDSIKGALSDLTGVQEDVGQSAKKTDTLLGALGQQLTKLNQEAKGLAALGKVSGELDKAAGAVDRLQKDVRSSAGEFARLARESEAASTNAGRLRSQLEAERGAVQSNTLARREARKELTTANKALREAERNQRNYNKAVASTPDVKRGSAARSAGAFLDADLDASRARAAQLTADITNYRTNIERARDASKLLAPQVAAAEQHQDRLARATDRSSKALAQNRDSLQSARGEVGQMRSAADAASQSFSGMALDQEKVSQASARMAAELARTKARLDGLSGTSAVQVQTAPAADTSNIEQQRRRLLELRKEWVQSEAEVKRLAQAMRATEAPTEQMGQALGRAQAASRAAKLEYQAQQVALRNLAGSAQSSFAAFSQSAERSAAATRDANRELARARVAAMGAASGMRPVASAATAAGQAMRDAGSGAGQMADGVRRIQGDTRRSLSLIQRLRGEVLSLTASFLGFYAAFNQIGQVVTAFQTLEAAQNRLGAVFDQDTARVGRELEWLERQADRLGIGFSVLADEYGKFAVAANASNFAAGATRDIFLSVAEAARVNKLSMDQMSGVFLALQQMISKGKVTSEELRRQLGDRMAGAFNIFAEALGMTAAELDAAMQKGEVLANQTNLLKFADELKKRFGPQLGEALASTSAEMGRFSNNVYQAQLRVAEGGFIEAFTNGLRELNEWFASREGRDFFLSLGAALGRFVDLLALVPDNLGLIQAAIATIVGLKLAAYFASVVTSIRASQGSLMAAVGAFYSWNATVKTATAATGMFTAASTGAGTAVTLLDRKMRLMSAATALVGYRVIALQGLLTGLRGVAIALTGTFRLLWTAVGGIPGIILTGITFALGSWLTSVDDTTSALDEHKRIMGEVITAYESVTDKTKEWANEIKNVTADQAVANLRKMQENLEKAQGAVADYGNMFSLTFKSDQNAVREIQRLRREFMDGERTAKSFEEALNDIYRATSDDGIRKYVEGILSLVRAAGDAETSLGEAAVVVREKGVEFEGLTAILEQYGISLDEIANGTDGAGDSLRGAAEKAKIFKDALAEIRGQIPGISAELERLGKIDALNKLYQDAANAATTMSQLTALTRDYNAALDGINSDAIESQVGNGSLIDRIIGVESNGDRFAKNDKSTATGLGQFISSTWVRMFKQYFPDRAEGMSRAAILALRTDAALSRQMVELYVRENGKILQNAGHALTDANLYLAHFLGPGGATKLLNAGANTPVSQFLDPDAIASNRSVLQGKTAAEVVAWAERKVGVSNQELQVQTRLNEIEDERGKKEQERLDKINDFNEAFDQRISDGEFELSIADQSNRDQEIQRALRQANNEAIKAGTKLTEEQRQQIIATTGALYDQKNEREGLNEAEERVNQLYTLRQQLLEQQRMARDNGESDKAAALGERLTEVNGQLDQAIEKAIAMWRAIGGPEADAAIAKLETMQMSAANVGSKLNMLGLNTEQIGQLAASFADGIVGVFDKFAESIANGENAVKALGQAFLQFASDFLREMAQMILRQVMLNALQRVLGIAVPGSNVGIAHTGGIVGSVRTGGNGTRSVSPALFAGALRYHNGGIAGLKPNEVPTILERGEEVLTRSDPRHAMNGGGASAPAPARPITVVNAFDPGSFLSEALGSTEGQEMMLNWVRANSAAFKGAMS